MITLTVNNKTVAVEQEYTKQYNVITKYHFSEEGKSVNVSLVPDYEGRTYTIDAVVVDGNQYIFPHTEYEGEEMTESQAFTAARRILKEYV